MFFTLQNDYKIYSKVYIRNLCGEFLPNHIIKFELNEIEISGTINKISNDIVDLLETGDKLNNLVIGTVKDVRRNGDYIPVYVSLEDISSRTFTIRESEIILPEHFQILRPIRVSYGLDYLLIYEQ